MLELPATTYRRSMDPLFLVLPLLALGLTGCCAHIPVEFRVVDKTTNRPLSHARVEMRPSKYLDPFAPADVAGTTDESGAVVLSGGRYWRNEVSVCESGHRAFMGFLVGLGEGDGHLEFAEGWDVGEVVRQPEPSGKQRAIVRLPLLPN
jgi:hypothetical protein